MLLTASPPPTPPPPCPPSACRITQTSFDGFGHQLEAKLSCIAAAAALNLTYFHAGFKGHAHGEDAREQEAFMSFGTLFPVLNKSRMAVVTRKPSSTSTWPFARPCRYCQSKANLSHACAKTHHAPGWLMKAATSAKFREEVCCRSGASAERDGASGIGVRRVRRTQPVFTSVRACVLRSALCCCCLSLSTLVLLSALCTTIARRTTASTFSTATRTGRICGCACVQCCAASTTLSASPGSSGRHAYSQHPPQLLLWLMRQ